MIINEENTQRLLSAIAIPEPPDSIRSTDRHASGEVAEQMIQRAKCQLTNDLDSSLTVLALFHAESILQLAFFLSNEPMTTERKPAHILCQHLRIRTLTNLVNRREFEIGRAH